MKVKLSLIVIVLLLLLQTPLRAAAYNDSVTLKIELIEEFKGFGTGSGYVLPRDGYKFIAVVVQAVNISEIKQEIIFDEICLPDTVKKTKYRPEFFMKSSIVTVYTKPYYTIKKGDSVYRRLVYSVPKNFDAFGVLYNNRIWTVEKRP